MSKKYWHTKTLFKKWNKFYWSYKYDFCIKCKTCNFKHKGNWLCDSCFDKERKIKNPKRVINLKKQNLVHYYKKRILLFLTKTAHKKKVKNKTPEQIKEYQKQWHKDNSYRISLQKKVARRLKKNLPCLQIIINWKTRHLPFADITKPATTTSKDYLEWKEKRKMFNTLVKFWKKQI